MCSLLIGLKWQLTFVWQLSCFILCHLVGSEADCHRLRPQNERMRCEMRTQQHRAALTKGRQNVRDHVRSQMLLPAAHRHSAERGSPAWLLCHSLASKVISLLYFTFTASHSPSGGSAATVSFHKVSSSHNFSFMPDSTENQRLQFSKREK